MSRARRLARLRISFALLLCACAVRAAAAPLFDPRYTFRVLPTPHFVIYFHQGEEHLASRLAGIAEEAWRALERPLGTRPPRLTHVVLVDQAELANGYASPVGRDTIVITAVWPSGSEAIGDHDDWLRLAFTHEFTHIVHLDRSGSWARAVRGIFGRAPLAFPNIFLPGWQIEGLATYEESALTGAGRLHAGDFRAIVDEAGRAGRLEPLDRANGGLTDWPNGNVQYAYGAGFHAYLAERYGAESFAALAEATARRVPYTASRVFKGIYGRSLGDLWKDYEQRVAASRPAMADDAERLTFDGFVAIGPRFVRPECGACPDEVLYASRSPHNFPALKRLVLDGSAPSRLVTSYLGSTTAPGRNTVYFDQQEVRRDVGLYSDLYALDRATGRVRRLTNEARLQEPDLSPDERAIVAVQNKSGQRDLVVVDVAQGFSAARVTPIVSEPETQFNAPRWSPDGRVIAAERHIVGRLSELVLVDAATRRVRVLASEPHVRWVTPVWRRDGHALVAAASVDDSVFNLYEVDLDAGARRQLTYTPGGATWPDVSPDGQTIVFVGYTADGFDLFRTPYRPATPTERGRTPFSDKHPEKKGYDSLIAAPYSPCSTLAPTWWYPVVEGDSTLIRVGGATTAYDVLGYHAYTASATWLASRPAGAPAVHSAEPDWLVSYAYLRWRPTFWATAASTTTFFAAPPTDTGLPSTSTERERQLEVGVRFPVTHARVAQTAMASIARADERFFFPDHESSRTRAAARAAWSIVSAHTYGYSISPERGVSFGLTAEAVRRELGASADAAGATFDARAYLPGLAPHHVLAIRAAGAATSGDRQLRRVFLLGGAAPNAATTDFGSSAISLLRGFPANTFAGTHVLLVNADYRFPLWRPQRGVGTWPIFLHTIHGTVFGDAGETWVRTFIASRMKTSVGAELSSNIVAGYFQPLTLTLGAAWGHDAGHVAPDRTTVYFRVGRAF